MELITAHTKKEDVLEEYKNYPPVKGGLEDKPHYESRYAPIFYEIPQGSKVLDVGCNDGVFMEMLRDKRGCDVMGIDVSEVALEEAKKRGLNVQIADVEALPFEDESFDVVTCMEVLSHLHDPVKALKEIRRVLKKNGSLLGSCPHKNIETNGWEDKRMHRRYYDDQELYQVLSGSFDRVWMKILKGGQFSIELANSFLADMPSEMLFKCGPLGWDAALQDRSVLRCWMGFTQTPGTVYYRMSGFADKMQKMGAEVHYNPYDENDFNSPGEWATKIQYLPHERRLTNVHIVNELESILKAADLSVFQVTSNRSLLLVLMTARKGVIKKPIWVEVDDWLFDVPSYNIASGPYQPNSEAESVAHDQIKLADGVICSTTYIKEKIEEMFPGKEVYVVRNSLDFDLWDKMERPTTLHQENPDLIRMVYSGCGNHSGDLEIIKKPLEALLDEFPNFEFVSLPFESTASIKNPRYKRFMKWVALSKFPQELANWEPDFGIAPLRDNELNRAKSNLRWLEYGALKVPCLASDVYPFRHSIKNGEDGILVGNSQKAWYEAMRSMILDVQKRKKMGQAAYERVKKDFNMEDVAKSYMSILKNIKSEFLKGKKGADAAA